MFAVLVPGRPVQTNLHAITPTHFATPLPLPLNHLAIFLLPDSPLPPTHLASVHVQFPQQPFRQLGYISCSKPSALFRLDARGAVGDVVLGVSIEEVSDQNRDQNQDLSMGIVGGAEVGGGAEGGKDRGKVVDTGVLANRIIRNAFNYMSSFAEGEGEAVVPLRSFRDWWRKFEKKIELDPGFLERDEE